MLRQMFFRTKKAFLCLALLVCCVVSSAQDLKVVSFEQTIEAYASINKRLDGNDVPCAVLKISIPDAKDFSFESGMRIGDVIYNPGEAIVYLASGARNITIKSDKYGVLKYTFPERTKLEKLVTYRLTVKIPSLGIGGRKVAFGVSGGYLLPMISTSSKGAFTGSVVNYALGNGTENASYSSSGGFSVGAHVDFRIWRSFHLITGINFSHYKYSNEFDGDVYIVENYGGAASYERRGTSQNTYKENYSMSSLEIPVLLSYRLPVTQRSHVQFNVGPVINYGLSAKMELSGSTDSETMRMYDVATGQYNDYETEKNSSSLHYTLNGEFDLFSKNSSFVRNYETFAGNLEDLGSSNYEESPFKRLNFGARFGVAYEYEGFSLGLEYNWMISNMANEKFWNGNRWSIYDNVADNVMSGYKQRNSYLKISLGYTFRY